MFASRMKCKEEDGIFRNCVILEECFLGDWLGCWFGVLGVKAPFYDLPIKSIFQRNFQKLKLPKKLPLQKKLQLHICTFNSFPPKKETCKKPKNSIQNSTNLTKKKRSFFYSFKFSSHMYSLVEMTVKYFLRHSSSFEK
jgi:hypothetical protein